ncbi:hypothetical protein HBB16_18080 [Pseudonocardia sp. MCCB 268]|nr:hypothetical protein [Pseudonocardia cytotoxica]
MRAPVHRNWRPRSPVPAGWRLGVVNDPPEKIAGWVRYRELAGDAPLQLNL